MKRGVEMLGSRFRIRDYLARDAKSGNGLSVCGSRFKDSNTVNYCVNCFRPVAFWQRDSNFAVIYISKIFGA